MNLRKATIRIVLAFVSVIAIGGMIASCSSDEFETNDIAHKKTLATRSANNYGDPNYSEMEFGDSAFFYIPSALQGQSGCGYKAIIKALEMRNITCDIDTVKDIMGRYCPDVEHYKEDSLIFAIKDLTDQTVSTYKGKSINENTPAVGDIICVPPVSYGDSAMTCGHATVVQSIESRGNNKLLRCYDGCLFDTRLLSIVIKTSRIEKR